MKNYCCIGVYSIGGTMLDDEGVEVIEKAVAALRARSQEWLTEMVTEMPD